MSPKQPKKRERTWPKPGYKIINGKRVYPRDEKPVIPVRPNMKQVNLDSGLPPNHPRTTPAIEPRLPGEQQLFELPSPQPQKIPPSDFAVLSATIQFLTNRIDEMHERLLDIETKPSQPSDIALFLNIVRTRCAETAFTGTQELRNFARSLVDMIDQFTNQLHTKGSK